MAENLRLSLLTPEETNRMYDKCLELLANKGIKVSHREALKIFDRAGAQVNFEDEMVRFPRDMVESALRTVPSCFTLAGIDKHHDLPLPHPLGGFYTRPNTGARTYIEPETNEYRDIDLAYVTKWTQLVEALDNIHFTAFPTPRDMPEATADVHALKTLLENTTKHIMVQPYSFESIEYLIALGAAMVGSTEGLKKKPIIEMIVCTVPPLTIKEMDMEAIIQSSRAGIPMLAASLVSGGGTGPITLAGTALLAGIEVLAMAVMAQLIQPGAKVVGAPVTFALDMATGRNLQASVESVFSSAAAAQFIKNAFHIPTHIYGFGTDSYVPGGQSCIESTLRGMTVALSDCDVLGGAGQLNVATALSPVQLIIDDTLVNILSRMKRGVRIDDETLAWKEIQDTTPGSHFLERSHTLKHCREAVRNKLFVNEPREMWLAEGSKDLTEAALEKYREIEKRLKPPEVSEEVKKEMDKLVRQADKRLAK